VKNIFAIPPHRVVCYVILASLLPVLIALVWTDSVISSAEADQARLLLLGEKIQKKSATQETNRQIIQKYRHGDPLYLHHKIEPLPLLTSETALLKTRLTRTVLPEDNMLEKRLNALSSDNHLCFVEGTTEVSSMMKETIENQNKPVEVDSDDLATVISLLDSQDENTDQKPHLIIAEAKIDRRKGLFQQTWGFMLKIIRREYL
jgi:hypothetical protein